MCGVLPRRRADGICSQHGLKDWKSITKAWLGWLQIKADSSGW
jgi:hypothetical protein